MTNQKDAYSEHRPHRAGADSEPRTFNEAIQDFRPVKSTPFLDYLESKKKQYFTEWRDQPFNFAAMHVFGCVLLGGIWFAVFVLPPAF
jgi:hypothetical protein